MTRSSSLPASERSALASLAALERWSREDPRPQAQRAQAGLLDKFRRQIADESPDIGEPELTRRAEARRRAHMKRLAYNREKARRQLREAEQHEREASRRLQDATGDGEPEASS